MYILLLGSKGRLGSCIKNFILKQNLNFIELNKKSFFSDQKKFENFLKSQKRKKINVIINCTALTDVDFCNKNFNVAYKVNSVILKIIAKSIANLKINPTIVHFSTDQIYNSIDFKKSSEDDINPTNFYGLSKYLGELNLSKIKKHLIIRTNFFGKSYNKKKITYSDFLIKNLKKELVKVPKNVFFNPILIDDLVEKTFLLINKKIYGTFNIGSRTYMSKYDFALYLAKKKRLAKKNIVSYKSIFSKHKRPLFTVMSTLKFEKKTRIKLPTLLECLNRL